MKTISQIRKPKEAKTKVQILIHEAGIGVRELAGFAGVSPATVSRVQRGWAPDIRTALLLAKFFETTVEELFSEFGK